MFTVLLTEPAEPQNLWQRLRWRFAPPPIKQERLSSAGTAFWQFTLPQTKKGVPWEALAALGGRYCRELVPQQGLELPEAEGFHRFVPRRFPGLLAIATIRQVLEESGIPPYCRRIGVIDESGKGAECLERLLGFCREVTVYTRNLSVYRPAAERMLERYGAPTILTERLDALATLPLLYAPLPCTLPAAFSSPALLFAPYGAVWVGGRVCSGFPLPEAQRPENCPPQVDANLFAAALFEKNGVSFPQGLAARAVCSAGREVPLPVVGGYLHRLLVL